MPWMILLSPVKSLQLTKYFSSMHPKVNTHLQILEWWVPLISALYIFSFLFIPLSILLNNQHQVSNRENAQRYSSILQNNNSSSINITNIKFRTKNSIKSASCALQRQCEVKHYVQMPMYRIINDKSTRAPILCSNDYV